MINRAVSPEETVTNNNPLFLLIYHFLKIGTSFRRKMSQMMKTFALESPPKAHSLNVKAAIKPNQRFTSLAMPGICCFVTMLALMKHN